MELPHPGPVGAPRESVLLVHEGCDKSLARVLGIVLHQPRGPDADNDEAKHEQSHLPNIENVRGGDGQVLRAGDPDLGRRQGGNEIREMRTHALRGGGVDAAGTLERLHGAIPPAPGNVLRANQVAPPAGDGLLLKAVDDPNVRVRGALGDVEHRAVDGEVPEPFLRVYDHAPLEEARIVDLPCVGKVCVLGLGGVALESEREVRCPAHRRCRGDGIGQGEASAGAVAVGGFIPESALGVVLP
mmetsp:Transcript_57286/g.181236  ORF Transcript_57286/g.181236 Transcript_57286/m.181236 type:complete len:243 (+) Transcript_57286:824-1552(+)